MKIMIGWTTLASAEEAKDLASRLVSERLAACVQVQGPIVSFYRWQGVEESAQEYRLVVKFPQHLASSLKEWLLREHPYDNPQWLAVEVDDISADYFQWIMDESDKI